MRIALAQLNPTVGDVAANTSLVIDAIDLARRDGADLLITSELVLIGYPPRDLLLRRGVVEACERAVERIAAAAGDMTVIVGHPHRAEQGVRGLRNRASVCRGGRVVGVADKRLLPGYDVFDEDRYFDSGDRTCTLEVGARRVAVIICEDLWRAGDVVANPRYASDPVAEAARDGCDVVCALNASPFVLGKHDRHVVLARDVAMRHGVTVAAVNQVGANDDLVFDGRSLLIDGGGSIVAQLPAWRPVVTTIDLAAPGASDRAAPAGDAVSAPIPGRAGAATSPPADLYHALVLAVRDYATKSRHERAILGLSGGIDSAVTAVIAAAALGAEQVRGVIMPSRYSSEQSACDARALAEALGLAPCEEIPIEPLHAGLRDALRPALGDVVGVTDENLQARIRGVLLMACANATGALLLATSNKSELAMGYCTLYGDMCGAIAVLGDVVKTRVYALARWINEHHDEAGFAAPPIPVSSIEKPPSAELRPDQTDQDTLPPYDVLDSIVIRAVEREESPAAIAAATGFDRRLVERVVRTIDGAEHKRFQAAIVPKVTQRAFGRGRPMPLVGRTPTPAASGAPVDTIPACPSAPSPPSS